MKYNVTINKNDINKLNNVEICDVTPNEKELKFKTNDKSLKLLISKIEAIKYENERKKRIISFFRKYFISIIFFFLMLFLLINESLIVKEIVFVNDNTYDQEVVNYIEKDYKKILMFKYLKKSIGNLNNDLKNNFYYYEWINAYKKGNKLLITIDKQDERSFIDSKSTVKGDIIASNDGIIRYYFVKKGVCIIKDNQSIKKGDVLISGNLEYYKENINKDYYIHPTAIVLAEVVSKNIIKVKKRDEKFIKTGLIQNEYFYSIFKKTLFDKEKCDFEMYEFVDEEEVSIGKIKKIKRTYFEVKTSITEYDKDTAYTYALSIIEKDFNINKIHQKEKILDQQLINYCEDDKYFYYTFLTKKIVNIAEFQAVRLEEN